MYLLFNIFAEVWKKKYFEGNEAILGKKKQLVAIENSTANNTHMATFIFEINYAPLLLTSTLTASRFSIFLSLSYHRNGVSKTIPANAFLVNYFDEKKITTSLNLNGDQGRFSHSIENNLHIFFLRLIRCRSE